MYRFFKGFAATLAGILFFHLNLQAQTPCVEGSAGAYPCNEVDLMAHLSPGQLLAEEHGGVWLNDIWGWTDPATGKEYALVGMTNGTSFVDVSDPVNPVVLGILPEHHAAGNARQRGVKHDGGKSVWRDIKVYRNHAFIVAEDDGHGMQVFDLTQLRNVPNPPATFTETANYQGIGKAHNIVINEETGFAYAVGATSPNLNCNGGGLHMINIQEPTNPVFAGCYDGDGYTHDAHCVVYKGPDADYQGQEVCFSSNEDAITMVNVSNKENPVLIASKGYAGVQYAHQGWLTEDHRYFISNDELDERRKGNNTTSFIWDMQDLDNPVLLGTYVGELPSIDHNLYIKDALVYEANYTSGLRILNIVDIENANLKEVAYFDTYSANDTPIFEGAWSNYPFFESGIVVVSDITNGLFVLRPTLGLIGEEPQDVVSCVGGNAAFELYPNQFGLGYQWQVNTGEGFVDLVNNEVYSNVNARRLVLTGLAENFEGNSYRVKLVNTKSGEEFFSEEAGLSLQGMPEAAFEIIEEKGVIQFTNLSNYATSYIWNFGDGSPESTKENPAYSYKGSGPFEVTLEAINDCGSDVFTMTIAPLGMRDEELAKGLKIYPNPSERIIHVQYQQAASTVTSLSLYSLSGQQLLYQKINPLQDSRSHKLDVSKFEKGMYFLKIETKKGGLSQRIFVK